MAGVPIPECPFPLRLHPDVEKIEADANAWAARVGLGGYETAQLGWLGAACHPDGSLARAVLATHVLQWIFAFDDDVDEPAAADPWRTARQAVLNVRVAEDPDHHLGTDQGPCLAALDDIARRLRALASPAQYERFVAGLTEFVLGEVCSSLVDPRIAPADYPTLRRYSTNGMLSFSMIDIAAGVELPDELWRRPDVRSLTRLATDLMGYTNDVFSAAKEHARDPDAVNLATMIAREQRVSLAEGVHQAAAQVNTLYTRFQGSVAGLRPTASPALDSYLTGLESWAAGHHHWCLRTSRYAETLP